MPLYHSHLQTHTAGCSVLIVHLWLSKHWLFFFAAFWNTKCVLWIFLLILNSRISFPRKGNLHYLSWFAVHPIGFGANFSVPKNDTQRYKTRNTIFLEALFLRLIHQPCALFKNDLWKKRHAPSFSPCSVGLYSNKAHYHPLFAASLSSHAAQTQWTGVRVFSRIVFIFNSRRKEWEKSIAMFNT